MVFVVDSIDLFCLFCLFFGGLEMSLSKSGNVLSRTSELHGRFHISWSDLLISDTPGGALAQAGEWWMGKKGCL